jgi:dTDP-4-dehydrorhamnose reductase
MRLAVIGARGQLGAAMVHAGRVRHDVVPLDRAALDVTDAAAVRHTLAHIHPDAVINCTAYNAVDAAEEHAADAFEVNSIAVRNLVRALGAAAFVHFSTDFVFDGTATRPYTEEDSPNPQSVYAMSKLVGEWLASDATRAYVLRVESLFDRAPDGARAKGSVAAIVDTLAAGQRPRVFGDRVVSPTSVIDGARATLELLERGARPGLYHCVSSGACTWQAFAEEAARMLGVTPALEVVSVADVKLPAPRPKFCALSNAKLAAAGVTMPSWQEALRRYLGTVSSTV